MRLKGPWPKERIEAFLNEAVIPMRLAVASASGVPLVLSLWFVWQEQAIWCATRGEARVVALLRRHPACGFEIAADSPPYRGVRGQGVASVVEAEGAALLNRLLDRYGVAPQSRLARRLTRHPEREVAIRIEPTWILSWDYSARMSDALRATVADPANRASR